MTLKKVTSASCQRSFYSLLRELALVVIIVLNFANVQNVSSLSPTVINNHGLVSQQIFQLMPRPTWNAFKHDSHLDSNNRKHRTCSTSLQDTASEDVTEPSFYIKNCLYGELGQVADILIESFYKPSPFLRQYYYLSELSRLQGNFPYGDVEHSFFVACLRQKEISSSNNDKHQIIGFVDVDARPRKKESDAPRPYLSDLAVIPAYRRIGVAQKLISECETEAKLWGKDELYLRVERDNDGALKMYKQKLGYEALDHHYFGVKDTTILLKRGFIEEAEAKVLAEVEADYII